MKPRAVVWMSLVAFAACGKDKAKSGDDPAAKANEPPPASGSGSTAATSEPKAEAAPPIAAPKGLFGCHAKDPAAQSAKRKPATPWQLPFTFAGCPSVPAEIYGTADFGMDGPVAAAAAKAKLEGGSAFIYLGKSPFRYQFTFRVDDDTQKVEKFTFKVDAAGFEEMKAAWGEPVILEHLSEKNFAWYNPEKHIKVTAHTDTWNRANPKTKEDEDVSGYWVYFQKYQPLAELVGKDGLLSKPIIGKTVAELAAAYPEWMEVKSKAENKATMDKIGVDTATQEKVQAMGAMGDTANLKLPETETNFFSALIQPDWTGGKVEAYSVLLPFGKDQALKQEILATVAAALGKPTGAKQDGDHWEYTFAGPNGTIVEMGMSILAEDWSLQVSAKN